MDILHSLLSAMWQKDIEKETATLFFYNTANRRIQKGRYITLERENFLKNTFVLANTNKSV